MAWIWWLLAPVAMTAVGAVVLLGGERWQTRRDRRDPVRAHADFLQALARSQVPASRQTPASGG